MWPSERVRRPGRWPACALALVLWACAAGPAQGFDVRVEAGLGAQTGWLTLSHDASGAFPGLGNPTSVLEHGGLTANTGQIAIQGRNGTGDGWFDLMAHFPLGGQGRFRDSDYFAGQVLFSHTVSDLDWWSGGVIGRIPMPGTQAVELEDWTVRPYLLGAVNMGQYSARGLACGSVCGALPVIAPETEVIGHGLAAVEGGAGAWLSRSVGGSGRIDIRADLSAGYFRVGDSHHFRPDLGPVPNIAFDFATLSVGAEIGYSHRLDTGATVTGRVFGDLGHGWGQAVFGAGLDPAIGTFPAWMSAGSAGVSLAMSVPF